MKRFQTVGLIVLVASVIAGCGRAGSGGPAAAADAVELTDYDFGGDFRLTSHLGQPFSLADVRGKAVFLFFGYTTCPDVCPMTMSKISDVVKRVPGSRESVSVLFVTVDVDRDTPAMLKNYVSAFGLPMVGLTGTRSQVDAVVAQYRSAYEITPSTSAAGPQVSHTSYTYLIDRSGKVRYIFSHDEPSDRIARALKAVLATS